MAGIIKTNQLPVITNLAGAKVIGLTGEGVDAQFPLDQLVRNNLGQFKTSDAAPGVPLLGQSYELIGSTAGSTPTGTYTNLHGIGGSSIQIPAPADGNIIINARAVWNGTYWVPLWQEIHIVFQDDSVLYDALPKSNTLMDTPAPVSGYYSTFEGGALLANNDYRSFKIAWADYDKKPINVSGATANVAAALVSYYDINNVYLGFQFRGSNTQVDTYIKEPLTIPTNTEFIGFTGLGSAALIYSIQIATDILTEETGDARYTLKSGGRVAIENPKQVKLKLAPADNIYLHGDSISSNDFTSYGIALADLTGVNVWRAGFPGFNAAQLTQDFVFQRLFDVSPKLILALVGANDAGGAGSVGTFGAVLSEPLVTEQDINVPYNGTTFIQAISYQMRKIKAHYYNIRERANLTGNETYGEYIAKLDAVNKPYLAFTTGLPQHRVNDSNPFSLYENWQRKRNAIVECCNRNNVHCIDTMNLIDYDIRLEPFSSEGNLGIYTIDGLHPNYFGAFKLAQIVYGGLGII
jgi:hypothetical protein